jgi:hypothetical protein
MCACQTCCRVSKLIMPEEARFERSSLLRWNGGAGSPAQPHRPPPGAAHRRPSASMAEYCSRAGAESSAHSARAVNRGRSTECPSDWKCSRCHRDNYKIGTASYCVLPSCAFAPIHPRPKAHVVRYAPPFRNGGAFSLFSVMMSCFDSLMRLTTIA